MSLKHKQIEALCYSIIDKYKPLMFLDAHTIKLKYHKDMDEENIMECEPVFPYFNARIHYGDSALKLFEKHQNNKKEQRDVFIEYIVHELFHIITAGLADKAQQRFVSENEISRELETLTDHAMKIIVNLSK
jgi:hypothetical protein